MDLDNEELKATKNRQAMELSKEEKKAIALLEKAEKPYYTDVVGSKWIKGYTTVLGTEVDNAIDIVLKLIQKQSKVIDEMAEYIRVKTDFTTVGNINAIKQYFYRKVEEDENI